MEIYITSAMELLTKRHVYIKIAVFNKING